MAWQGQLNYHHNSEQIIVHSADYIVTLTYKLAVGDEEKYIGGNDDVYIDHDKYDD